MGQNEPTVPHTDEIEDISLDVDLILVIEEVEEAVEEGGVFFVGEDLGLVEDGEHLSWVVEEKELCVGKELSNVLIKLDVLLEVVEEVVADDYDLLTWVGELRWVEGYSCLAYCSCSI